MSGILEVHHDPAATGTPASAAPLFLYDLASPECYLAAERAADVLGVVPEWEPVLLADLPGAGALDAFRCADEREIHLLEVERRAARRAAGDPLAAGMAAGHAAGHERGHLRQADRPRRCVLAGRIPPGVRGRARPGPTPTACVIAAAACEMHPAAVLKAGEMRSVR